MPPARAKPGAKERCRGPRARHDPNERPHVLAVPARGPYVLAARAAGHAPLASAATHAGGERPVGPDPSLPGGMVPARR
ncbi:MFS transporter, partial [Streptomyces sp. G35A]